MADQVTINGSQMSWASLTVRVSGMLLSGYTALSYDDKREQALLWGAGHAQIPRGKTSGQYTPGVCKITGYVSTVQEMRALLAQQSPSGTSYGGVDFQVVAQFIELGSEEAQTVVLGRCTWVSNSASFQLGTDGLAEDVEFQPMWILRNGLSLYEPLAL
jgi:hypothetical protein